MDKQYEIAKKEILRDFLKQKDNIYFAEKIFMAISVLKWASEQRSEKEIFSKYMTYIGKYLYSEVDLYWENGIIRIKPIKSIRGKNNDS